MLLLFISYLKQKLHNFTYLEYMSKRVYYLIYISDNSNHIISCGLNIFPHSLH